MATFTEGTYHGKTEVEAAFRRTFDLIRDEAYRMEDIRWLLRTEHFAVLSFAFHWSGVIDGKPVC